MVAYKTLDQLDVAGKRVLMRVDLNVPVHDGKIGDATRIERLVPTIERLSTAGARIILISHFGRPKGKRSTGDSLARLGEPLSLALGGTTVVVAEHCIGETARLAVAALGDGDVLLLENLRFHAEEEENDPGFAQALASLADLYVNDAFSVSHRAHASTEAVAKLLPCAAGLLMQAELDALSAALEHPARPLRLPSNASLVDTLAPPTIAITGRCGVPSAASSASSLRCISRPA